MATGSDSHTIDDEHPAHTDDAHAAHDDHGHDAHGHDDHGSGGDAWVLIPIGIGLLIGLLLALYFGLGSGASPLN
jgi:hypothetical protein